MSTFRRVTALLAAVVAGLLVASGAAWADGSGRIVQIQQAGSRLHLVFSATGLAAGTALDPSSVAVTVNGRPVHAAARTFSSADASKVSRTALLVIDTSGSMRGAGLTGAVAAAHQFLDDVPSDVRVGVIAVSSTPSVAVAPTLDHAAVANAVDHLRAGGRTALYDAVALALRTGTGTRNVVVLSDGGDTTSHTSLTALAAAVKTSKATIEAVGFHMTPRQSGVLHVLARAGAGSVVTAGQAGGLAAAFVQAARDIAGQLVIDATLPAGMAAGSSTISVRATAAGTTYSDSAFASLAPVTARPTTAGARPVTLHPVGSNTLLYAGAGAVFVGILVLLAVAFTSGRSETSFGRRLSIYTLTGRAARKRRESTALGDSDLAHSAVDLAGRVVAKRGFDDFLAVKLDSAGVPLKPSEWLLLHVGSVVLLPPLLLILTGGDVLFALLGAVVGAAAPWGYLSVKQSRRQSAFLAQLPDTLQLLAGGLQAGYSLPQALDSVVREGAEPVASEFNRALVDARLGVTIEDALDAVAERVASTDFSWVVMAIRIQREVGGNLAEVLTNVAATLRERERLRRQVKVLSAEGRLSAWILGSLPVLFGAYLSLVRRDYISVLVTDPLGVAMLIVLGVAMTAGILWLRKIVRVEV